MQLQYVFKKYLYHIIYLLFNFGFALLVKIIPQPRPPSPHPTFSVQSLQNILSTHFLYLGMKSSALKQFFWVINIYPPSPPFFFFWKFFF